MESGKIECFSVNEYEFVQRLKVIIDCRTPRREAISAGFCMDEAMLRTKHSPSTSVTLQAFMGDSRVKGYDGVV